jgi:hypothetical protein
MLLALTGCDTVEDRPARWSYVHAGILAPSCATASCHSTSSSTGGIDLSSRENAYAFMLGRTCRAPDPPGEPAGNFVFPFQPERSRLMYLLRGEETFLMPPDAPLVSVEIEIIEDWILAGAECD